MALSHAERRVLRGLFIISAWRWADDQDRASHRRLLLPVSNDTLLRVVRRRAARPTSEPRVIGIDDLAWKRGHRYGTIICDLERRRIIDILPDREAATATAWLADHPSITVIARDRGAGYKQAATEGRPDAVQVADRWHLMENASAAFLTAVQRSMVAIRKAVGAGTVDPAALERRGTPPAYRVASSRGGEC